MCEKDRGEAGRVPAGNKFLYPQPAPPGLEKTYPNTQKYIENPCEAGRVESGLQVGWVFAHP